MTRFRERGARKEPEVGSRFKTKADLLVELLEVKHEVSLDQLPKLVDAKRDVIREYLRILEEAGVLRVVYKPRATVRFVKSPDGHVKFRDEKVVLNRIKILLEMDNLKEVKNLLYELYTASQQTEDHQVKQTYSKAPEELIRELELCTLHLDRFVMDVKIAKATKNTLDENAGRPNDRNALRGAIQNEARDAVENEHDEPGLPFEDVSLDGLSLTSWEQIDPWTIHTGCAYDLVANSSRGINWSVSAETATLEFSIVGSEHPDPAFSVGGNITKEFWVVNDTTADNVCFLNEISNSYDCLGVKPVCPLAICR